MKKLRTFIETRIFQNIILGVIIFNSILMGLQTSKTIAGNIGGVLTLLDQICLGIFIVELLLKIIAYNKNFLKDGWNIFDFLVIVVSVVPNLGTFSVLRIFRIFRVLKSLKALRALKLVSGLKRLRIIIAAIFKSIPSISWTAVLLFLIYYIYAILGVTLFGEAFPDWFGSLGKSLYTLFQVMTMESWSMGISRPVMEVFGFAWIYFISFVLITAFVVMNVVVGIVVNAIGEVTETDRKEELENSSEDLKKEFEKLRTQMDVVESLLDNNSTK